jgi:putative ABC transport system permease protein
VVRARSGRSLTDPPRPAVFVPYSQAYSPELNLIVRTEGDPAALVSPIQRAIEQVDDTIPLRGIRTLESQVAETLWPSRAVGTLISSFGGLALLLAAMGIYG